MAAPLGFGVRCPDGHRWYACRHQELAHPTLGAALMGVGTVQAFAGLWVLLHG